MQIKLSFLGAAQNVTGSRHMIEANGSRILVDCGLYQERQFRSRNWEKFAVPAKSIDAVLLTHAHIDHCGLLPKLVREGFKGNIYCTRATSQIAKIVLLDSARLQEEDAQFKQKRHRREARKTIFPEVPLYTIEDAQNSLKLFSSVKYKQIINIKKGIQVVFHDAGHILGSAIIEVKVEQNSQKRTIVFSGDIGRNDRPIVNDPSVLEKADYLLIESTYGNRIHRSTQNVKQQLAKIVNNTKQAGGNIVVPSFAVERSQEILYYLNELLAEDAIPHLMVFLDSPMAAKVTEIFKKSSELFDEQTTDFVKKGKCPFDFSGLKVTATADESKAINHIKGTVIIIAGSGMCTGGRVKHHLVNNIGRPESTVMFVGYQAIGTLGRQIANGKKKVRILGNQYNVKAKIAKVNGFSAHADKNELLEWLKNFRKTPKQIFVVHGESESANGFAKFVNHETGWQVTVPHYQQQVILD